MGYSQGPVMSTNAPPFAVFKNISVRPAKEDVPVVVENSGNGAPVSTFCGVA
jgi:hypothetical protein